MLPRARVAAACSVALVLVTICTLVALRGTAPDQPGAATTPTHTDVPFPSCDDQCRHIWAGNGYIVGTAPLCDASCVDCGNGNRCLLAKPSQPDYGHHCHVGGK